MLKLKSELPALTEKFRAHLDVIAEYAPELKASGDYKNFDVRLAADCLYLFARRDTWTWREKYDATDAQINAVGRAALRALGII